MRIPARARSRRALLALTIVAVALGSVGAAVAMLVSQSGGHKRIVKQPNTQPVAVPTPLGLLPRSAFGVVVHDPAAAAPGGSWLINDDAVSWAALQPAAAGQWDAQALSRLDAYVTRAVAHHADPVLVLSETPRWASRAPQDTRTARPGAGRPPRQSKFWEDFVRTVATRYRGRVHFFQVWTDANDRSSWNASPASLAQLAVTAQKVVRAVDPADRIIAPSVRLHAFNAVPWLTSFLSAEHGTMSDVVAIDTDLSGSDTPETPLRKVRDVQAMLLEQGLHRLPVWDTDAGTPTSQQGASPAVRTFATELGFGIERVFWDAPAAVGLNVAQRWLTQTTALGCQHLKLNRAATWGCDFRTAGGTTERVWWTEKGRQQVDVAGARFLETLTGSRSDLAPGQRITLSTAPVLLVGIPAAG